MKEELSLLGIEALAIDLGVVELGKELTADQRHLLQENLLKSGLQLLDDNQSILIDRIKNVIIDMIHYMEELPTKNYSEYISEKLNYDYTYLRIPSLRLKGSPYSNSSF